MTRARPPHFPDPHAIFETFIALLGFSAPEIADLRCGT